MIPYGVYKIIHFTGIFMIVLSFGGATMHAIEKGGKDYSWKKSIMITHGLGLFLAILGGFGLLARLGVTHGGLPKWVLAKIAIWFVLAALIVVVSRQKTTAKPIWFLVILLTATGAYLAGYKPF